MKLSRKILCGLVVITTVLFAAIIFAPCLKLSDEFKNVVTGVFTSSLVVLIIELISLLHDLVNLSKLKGTYTRKEITNWDQGHHHEAKGSFFNRSDGGILLSFIQPGFK